MTTIADFDRGLAFVENDILAWVDYVPLASIVSGAVRFVMGKVEAITALAVSIFKFIASLFKSLPERKQLEREAVQALEYGAHGLTNMFRGFFAAIPILGNIGCLVYDLTGNRLRYRGEIAARPLSLV